MTATTAANPKSVALKVSQLPDMAMADLWALWDEHFPKRPNHWNRDYVESRLAHRIQELAFGGLRDALKSQLLQLGAAESKFNRRAPSSDLQLVPGTVLVREYDEIEHRVLVTSDGQYELNGRRFKSLSAVARMITGTQWSGPVFFGLKGRKAKAVPA